MLNLDELSQGTPGITPQWGSSLAQAAGVSLEEQGHIMPALMHIEGEFSEDCSMVWPTVNGQTRRCWNDLDEAAEHGAYGIAALLIQRHTDFEIVERSRKGTGFDYWIGDKGQVEPLFQAKARLEVSGIKNGTESDIRSRVRYKLKQTERSDGPMPAYVIVVEYGQPQARVVKK